MITRRGATNAVAQKKSRFILHNFGGRTNFRIYFFIFFLTFFFIFFLSFLSLFFMYFRSPRIIWLLTQRTCVNISSFVKSTRKKRGAKFFFFLCDLADRIFFLMAFSNCLKNKRKKIIKKFFCGPTEFFLLLLHVEWQSSIKRGMINVHPNYSATGFLFKYDLAQLKKKKVATTFQCFVLYGL